MRKATSTNTLNEKHLIDNCSIFYTFSVLGGRWKLNILAYLMQETLRFSELREKLPGISDRQLTTKLKEMENDGLIQRTVFPEVPPKVEYDVTHKGLSLKNIMDLMSEWGEIHRPA